MAMQESGELSDLVATLLQELTRLDFSLTFCIINIYNEPDNSNVVWAANPEEGKAPESYYMKFEDYPFHHAMMREWKAQTPKFVYIMEGEEKAIYDDYLYTETEFRRFPEEVQRANRALDRYVATFVFSHFGGLQTVGYEPLSDESIDILYRFGKVFDLTYTRFNDLQKAEAQAREAQIEAALERVRSRTMAMHKSDELAEVVAVIYQEVGKLGLAEWGSNIQIFDEKENKAEIWISENLHDILPRPYYFRDAKHPDILAQWEAWRNKVPQHTLSLEGAAKKSYDDYVLTHTDFIHFSDEMKKGIRSLEQVHFNMAWMQYGFIVSVKNSAALDKTQFDILSRFAKVFEQTYTRFLDLQKAEAQAREAQIEVALERVRSRAIAMRHSHELSEAAELLYKEFLKMGVESFSCGYLINDDEKGEWKIWLTNPGEAFFKEFWTVPYHADHNLKARYESWKSKEEFHCAVLEGEENRAHHVVISKYAPWKKAMLETLPPRLVFNSAHFSLGHLLVISPERLAPELEQAMVRFAKVFDLTWRRFLDLQKAEARAREERIEAGLDRVRAEIASMRSTEDLERITPLVWRELTTLEVPFFRCGVFIMDEEKEIVHTYLSTPEGKSLGLLQLPFDETDIARKTVSHWRSQEAYRDNWDRQQFTEWVQSLMDQGYIRESQSYQGADQPPEKLALNFVPFKQGMLYVGNSEQLSTEQLTLVKRLADSFAVAYARYEDFNRLEEAKGVVEKTLYELKATQSQLIQSEKMASLGELTAGIAHEIQNPLNFVNNFSEVNSELIDEIKLAVQTGNASEVLNLADNIKQNLEKVSHHGKRADAIVKGMLAHSRSGSGEKVSTDINALADEYLRLSYHGLRAKDNKFNADFKTNFDPDLPNVNVIPQDIGRVLLNLINNAFQACTGRSPGAVNGYGDKPTVTVTTRKTENGVQVSVADNGPGIPDSIKEKIFQPFFTTKPTGQGTGLGLSLAYDLITKGHGGSLKAVSEEGRGAEFIIQLPV
jgi:signal transduction histidine kinase